jgi:hypothetical protein
MSLQVQLRRGTSSQHASFVGRAGELIYTTDTKRLFVHDGTTAGGTEIGSLSSLAAVASSGSYNDLSNLPDLFSGNYNDLNNLPTIPTDNVSIANGAGYTTNTGTVTQVSTGTSLTGGPITTTGTISIANGGVVSAMLATTLDFGSIA